MARSAGGASEPKRQSIDSKQQFYREFRKGAFGNHSPMWDTFESYWDSGYPDLIAIRTKAAGGRCDYLISRDQARSRYLEFLESYSPYDIHFSAQCPETDKTIQGYVQELPGGWELTYSRSLDPMRIALETDPHHASGLLARSLIEQAMDSGSFDWLQELFTLFPGHVVEFTCIRYPWGVIPGSNTLFWEVRNY